MDWMYRHVWPSFLGLSVLNFNKDIISAEVIRYYNEMGVRVVAWTINNPKEKEYFHNTLKITYFTDTLQEV